MSIVTLAEALAEGKVGSALARWRPGGHGCAAAVLVLLSPDEEILLLVRPARMRTHGGQVAFPGGATDPGETPEETALREAWEELGIRPEDVCILGALPSLRLSASGFDVVPVVGWWRGDQPLVPNHDEVASAAWVPIVELADPANRFTAILGPQTTPGFSAQGMFVWGFTAYVVDEIVRADGWERLWDHSATKPVPRY